MSEGQKLLRELGKAPVDSYEFFFSLEANELGLGTAFDRNDLRLLFEASLRALACDIALNDKGASPEKRFEEERRRRKFEYDFMDACQVFFACPGWQSLPAPQQETVRHRLLEVRVHDDTMAW